MSNYYIHAIWNSVPHSLCLIGFVLKSPIRQLLLGRTRTAKDSKPRSSSWKSYRRRLILKPGHFHDALFSSKNGLSSVMSWFPFASSISSLLLQSKEHISSYQRSQSSPQNLASQAIQPSFSIRYSFLGSSGHLRESIRRRAATWASDCAHLIYRQHAFCAV
ncbi:Metallo-dependent phosphatase [Alternaria alternata]|nr:Metallo-dependent phosphatase [Alternaria alternata]